MNQSNLPNSNSVRMPNFNFTPMTDNNPNKLNLKLDSKPKLQN